VSTNGKTIIWQNTKDPHMFIMIYYGPDSGYKGGYFNGYRDGYGNGYSAGKMIATLSKLINFLSIMVLILDCDI
jgi:hypothetical protein